MNTSIKAVIFDLDGVLTDTAEFHYRAWKQLADEEGLPFSRADNEYLRGVSRRESLLRLLKGREFEEAKMQDMMERKNHFYQSLLTQSACEFAARVEDFLIYLLRRTFGWLSHRPVECEDVVQRWDQGTAYRVGGRQQCHAAKTRS
jgi:beta-phosphoglucomutase-like phosphatase (HAD superfamily)